MDTLLFRATLATTNEVSPPSGEQGSGTAIVSLHLARDNAGVVTFGVVDFDVAYNIPAATVISGLRIHSGAAGASGPIVIPSGLTNTSHAGGVGRLLHQVVVNDPALLNRMAGQSDQFYVNLQTQTNAGGLIRGQLAAAEMLVLRAPMSPANGVPPTPA